MSVRWSGFLKPLFAEEYTFLVQVNDGIKVWIDDAILIDEYDKNTPDGVSYLEYEFTTNEALVAGRLTAIKVEFRENRGDALIRLSWKSQSQDLAVIHPEFLYSQRNHLSSSIEPTEPTSCELIISDWNE